MQRQFSISIGLQICILTHYNAIHDYATMLRLNITANQYAHLELPQCTIIRQKIITESLLRKVKYVAASHTTLRQWSHRGGIIKHHHARTNTLRLIYIRDTPM